MASARPHAGAADRQEQALGEHLPHQPPVSGAQGRLTATSRTRPSARASSRLATLAHAISRRKPTATPSSMSRGRTVPRISSSRDTAKAAKRIASG